MKENRNMKWRKGEERVKGNVDEGTGNNYKKKQRVDDQEKMDNYHKDVEEISLCMQNKETKEDKRRKGTTNEKRTQVGYLNNRKAEFQKRNSEIRMRNE